MPPAFPSFALALRGPKLGSPGGYHWLRMSGGLGVQFHACPNYPIQSSQSVNRQKPQNVPGISPKHPPVRPSAQCVAATTRCPTIVPCQGPAWLDRRFLCETLL